MFCLAYEIRTQLEQNSTHYVLVSSKEEILKYYIMGIWRK